MNDVGSFVVCLALLLPAAGVGQDRTAIPEAARAILDQRYPGWRVAGVSSEVRAAIGQRLGPTPGVISGDFDGNGRADYAIVIEYENRDEPAKAFTHFV